MLVKEYQGMIVNTCYGFLFNKEDSEDLAQEIFVEVYQGIKNFKEESKLSTWLYRIAINRSIDFLRKKKRKKRFGNITGFFGNDWKNINTSDNSFNPHETMEENEKLAILNIAISELPQNQNIAFRLNKFEGLAGKQVAEIMKITPSAVESLLHRAKNNLKDILKNYYENRL